MAGTAIYRGTSGNYCYYSGVKNAAVLPGKCSQDTMSPTQADAYFMGMETDGERKGSRNEEVQNKSNRICPA